MLKQLQARYPALHYVASTRFCWAPETGEIFYDSRGRGKTANWSLLHETGHALLNHQTYLADFELVQIEMAAWAKARELATELGVTIDEDHIQDCLDTYRDWLYKRSICPQCSNKTLQQSDYAHYRCFNCHKVWRVTPSRFGRAYRSTKNVAQTPSAVYKKIPAERRGPFS